MSGDASVVERLRREFFEDTGLSIEVGALLYVRECPEAETETVRLIRERVK